MFNRLVQMAMCESLHHTSPLPSPEQKQTTLTYQPHLTATSLTLLGQGLGILWTILVVFRIWWRICQNPISFLVIPSVIVTVQNKERLLWLFDYHIFSTTKKIGFTHNLHFPYPVLFLATCLHHLFCHPHISLSSSSSPWLETHKRTCNENTPIL